MDYGLGSGFFSVCLGGASMVVYGSYIDDNVDIPSSAFNTAFLILVRLYWQQ